MELLGYIYAPGPLRVSDPDEQKLMIAVRDAEFGLNLWKLPPNWQGKRERYWYRTARSLMSRGYLGGSWGMHYLVLSKDGVSAMVNSSIWRLSLEDHPTHVAAQT